jgi:hypothetical protein
MPQVNYLAPLPQMPSANKYSEPKTSPNSNFSKILDSQKKVDSRTAYTKSIAKDFVNTAKNTNIAATDKNGTNIAIKELAMDMEQQFLAYMWNLAFSSATSGATGGDGEVIFQQELVDEVIRTANDGDMGEIAQDIYEEVARLEGIKNDSGIGRRGRDK